MLPPKQVECIKLTTVGTAYVQYAETTAAQMFPKKQKKNNLLCHTSRKTDHMLADYTFLFCVFISVGFSRDMKRLYTFSEGGAPCWRNVTFVLPHH